MTHVRIMLGSPLNLNFYNFNNFLALKYNFYYDQASRGYSDHGYIGLYKGKSIRAIGKLKKTVIAEESKFIMLNIQNTVAGCIVDEVTDIVTISDEQIQQQPEFVANLSSKYLVGIGKIDERLIIILNPENILSTEEYEALTG